MIMTIDKWNYSLNIMKYLLVIKEFKGINNNFIKSNYLNKKKK